jgi:hypothetical protein
LEEDCLRKAVAYLFVSQFKTIDNNQNAWGGRNGVCKKIKERLGLNISTKIDHILNDVLACKQAGISYEGER